MTAGDYCTRDVVVAKPRDSVKAAVELMRSYHVGNVVVVDDQIESPRPVGILTDRDIVLALVAKEIDPDSVTIADVMSYKIITVVEDATLSEVIDVMKTKGVRRLPVISAEGGLVGIIASDDILDVIAEELQGLAGLLKREVAHESTLRA